MGQILKVLFPDSQGRGTHVNISGMAMAKHAPNRDNALKLMEFLASAKAQEIYAEQVYEYPLKDVQSLPKSSGVSGRSIPTNCR